MSILVTGGKGQLAEAIRRTWIGWDLHFVDLPEFDLLDPEAPERILDRYEPGIVVNCGAHTHVDRCESEVDLAMEINGRGVGRLAQACAKRGIALIQISTDYVFDGLADHPYLEEDPVHPQTVYGQSKLLGETEARKCPRHLIVRTSWLYDAWGQNFLITMLKLGKLGQPLRVVDDQWGSPTSCRSLARQLEAAIREDWQGLVHASCHGSTTWRGFAQEIFRRARWETLVEPCTTQEYPRPAPRPRFSVLSGTRRTLLGSDLLPEWRVALQEVMAELHPEAVPSHTLEGL